jgi:phosphomannomutase
MTPDSELIVSVSGIRGIVGKALTPQAALAFAQTLAEYAGGGKVVLSRDGRPSGAMLRHAVLAGLLSGGCDVIDLGIVPTPTCGLAVRRVAAAGGIQITASHNPAEWNGLKLFGTDGAVLTAHEGQKIKALFDRQAFRSVPWDRLGQVAECGQAETWHRQRVLELVDAGRIHKRNLPVFLDANGGAGGPLGLTLLDALGCRVMTEGAEADGVFRHEPEPVAANLGGVCSRVADSGAAIGFVLDPDADRLALIDEAGHYIGEELTLALAVLCRLEQQPGPVVINMSTSRVVEDICRRFAVPCQRSAVGEANVVQQMRQAGAVIGGEGNGGVIDPRVGWVRDPFIGMGLILSLLARTGKKLSELAGEVPAYTIVKTKFTVDRKRLPGMFATLEARWPQAGANRLDGLRLDWEDRWVHVRPSNTEPIVRVIAEAPKAEEADRLCREVGELLG